MRPSLFSVLVEDQPLAVSLALSEPLEQYHSALLYVVLVLAVAIFAAMLLWATDTK